MSIKRLLMSSNYFVLNKQLVRILGIETAFLLSTFVEADETLSDSNGWFYQTALTIEEITGLSNHKQSKCIEQLISLGILLQENKGMPMKRYFKLNYEKISEILEDEKNSKPSIEKNQKQGFKNFESKVLKNSKASFQKISNNKEHNINNINKEHNIKIDDTSTNSKDVQFRKNLHQFIDLVSQATNLEKPKIEQVLDIHLYKKIDFLDLIKKIKESNFLSGKCDTKPRINHFITEMMIKRILIGYYDNIQPPQAMKVDDTSSWEKSKKETDEFYEMLGL